MPHPATERSLWELGGGTRHLWSGSPTHQPLPEPLGASSECEHWEGGSCPALLAPTDRVKEVKARVVVKMMVIKDCSRVCARVMSKRRLGTERWWWTMSRETGPTKLGCGFFSAPSLPHLQTRKSVLKASQAGFS